MKQKHLFSIICIAAIALVGATVFGDESYYEWIIDGSIKQSFASKTLNKLYWSVETVANYDEYRTIYVCNSWSSNANCNLGEWIQLTNCNKHNYVNGIINEACFDTNFSSWATGGYPARATVNWAGCGTYALEPTPTCGDWDYFNLSIP